MIASKWICYLSMLATNKLIQAHKPHGISVSEIVHMFAGNI